jgi:serine/threonine protein kinase
MTRGITVEESELHAAVLRIGMLDGAAREAALQQLTATNPDLAKAVADTIRAAEAFDEPAHDEVPDPAAAIARLARDACADRLDLPTQFGRYRLVERLAGGGSGSVYLAEQSAPRRIVAIKLLRRDLGLAHAAFEAAAIGGLSHPGLAQIFDAGTATAEGNTHETAYIVMEYVDGRPITSYAREKRLSTAARLDLLLAVADAIAHLHDHGVVHSDIKPANILVDHHGRPRVIDFGVARIERLGIRVDTGSEAQPLTPGYAAPELVGGDAATDERVDVFAFAQVAHEVLTQQHAEVNASEATVNQSLQAAGIARSQRVALTPSISTALAARATDRVPSIRELQNAFRAARDGRPWSGSPPSAIDHLALASTRVASKARHAPAVVLLLLAVASIPIWLWRTTAYERNTLQAEIAHSQERIANAIDEMLRSESARADNARSSLALLDAAATTGSALAARDPSRARMIAMGLVRGSGAELSGEGAARATEVLAGAELLYALGADDESIRAAASASSLLNTDNFEYPEVQRRIDLFRAMRLREAGRTDEALAVLETRRPQSLSPRDPIDADAVALLAEIELDRGNAAAASDLVAPLERRLLNITDPLGPTVLATMARTSRRAGDLARAEALLRRALDEIERDAAGIAGPSYGTARVMIELSAVLSEQGRPVEAHRLLTRLVSELSHSVPDAHPLAIDAEYRLIRTTLNLGRFEDAESVLEHHIETLKQRPNDHAAADRAYTALVDLRRQRGDDRDLLQALDALIDARSDRYGNATHQAVLAPRVDAAEIRLRVADAPIKPAEYEQLTTDAMLSAGPGSVLLARAHRATALAFDRHGDKTNAHTHAVAATDIASFHNISFGDLRPLLDP